jgi:pyrroloquinoline quinone biosynthesis protein E
MVYPCPVASEITTVSFDSVREHELGWIWRDSPGFNAYRGTSWMPSPCRGCSRKELDFGGCRCQAFALTGDAGRTDPACIYAPDHELVRAAREQAEHAAPDPELLPAQLRYRRPSPCSVR